MGGVFDAAPVERALAPGAFGFHLHAVFARDQTRQTPMPQRGRIGILGTGGSEGLEFNHRRVFILNPALAFQNGDNP